MPYHPQGQLEAVLQGALDKSSTGACRVAVSDAQAALARLQPAQASDQQEGARSTGGNASSSQQLHDPAMDFMTNGHHHIHQPDPNAHQDGPDGPYLHDSGPLFDQHARDSNMGDLMGPGLGMGGMGMGSHDDMLIHAGDHDHEHDYHAQFGQGQHFRSDDVMYAGGAEWELPPMEPPPTFNF